MAILAVITAASLAAVGWLVKTIFHGIRSDITELKHDVRTLTHQLGEIIAEFVATTPRRKGITRLGGD